MARQGFSMLHAGSQWPQGVTPMPSPAVPTKFEMPHIEVVAFFTRYREPPERQFIDPNAPPPMMIEEDWVTWAKKGDQQGSTTSEAIKRLKGDEKRGIPHRIEWLVVGPA